MCLKIAIVFFMIFPSFCFSQNKNIDLETVETVCKAAEREALFALEKFSAITDNFNNLSTENMRTAYIESMNAERERIKKIINTSTYDIILNSSSVSFKYALCQKKQRPSTSISTIASEVYFLCRKSLSTGLEQMPPTCF